ncbi:sensor histidine kinase [Arthrobacter sp. NPDC058192]|uniref:sensor histidine kinase n=1 Tax=Arthrobacter sp. NPDC058192 TaxID=3346372 RepID=UPI0036F17B97
MASNHWAIYLGSFIALGFILWTAPLRLRYLAAGTNVAAAAVMAFLMLSWRYGDGVGWYPPAYAGDRWMLQDYGWQLFALLLLIAGACAAVGLLLALYQERGSLFRARELAQSSLKETEIDLIVEQERTRIARDLHDVLAHSLAVIAAQADGTRYLSKDQPKAVLNALDTIAGSARSALVDAQRVIEGVRDDGMVTPQPRLSDIPALIDGMQRGSLKIHPTESGTPVKLSTGQEMAVFRIVQECLTNALKHGGRGTDVRLHFDWSGPGLTLHVASAVAPTGQEDAANPARTRGGRGLPGMRERAHLAGGWLTAGPDGEHFRVTVFIPYGTREARAADETAGAEARSTFGEISGDEVRPALTATGLPRPAGIAREAHDRG